MGQGSSPEEIEKLQQFVGTSEIEWPQFLQVRTFEFRKFDWLDN